MQLHFPAAARQIVGGERAADGIVGPFCGRRKGDAAFKPKRVDGAEVVCLRVVGCGVGSGVGIIGQDVPFAGRVDGKIRSIHPAVEPCAVGQSKAGIACPHDPGNRKIGLTQGRAIDDQRAVVHPCDAGVGERPGQRGSARTRLQQIARSRYGVGQDDCVGAVDGQNGVVLDRALPKRSDGLARAQLQHAVVDQHCAGEGIVAADDPRPGAGLGKRARSGDRALHHGDRAVRRADRAVTDELHVALRGHAGVQL